MAQKKFSDMEKTMILSFLHQLMDNRDRVDMQMQQFTAALLKCATMEDNSMPALMLAEEDVKVIGWALASISMLLDLLCVGPQRTMEVLFDISPTCVPMPQEAFNQLTEKLKEMFPAGAEPDPKQNEGDSRRN